MVGLAGAVMIANDFSQASPILRAAQMPANANRGGLGFSDRGISGFLPGHHRREIHEKTET